MVGNKLYLKQLVLNILPGEYDNEHVYFWFFSDGIGGVMC